MSRMTRDDLLYRALRLLSDEGPKSLTVDRLCEALGVTKGSFYHHFANRDEFVDQLLDYWVERNTLSIIELAEAEGSPTANRRKLIELALGMEGGPDQAIRAWALHGGEAESAVERVDAIRLDYLRELFVPFTRDEAQARRTALIAYSMHLGVQAMRPAISPAEHAAMIAMVSRGLGLPPLDAEDGQNAPGGAKGTDEGRGKDGASGADARDE